jgi:hypothetical protein
VYKYAPPVKTTLSYQTFGGVTRTETPARRDRRTPASHGRTGEHGFTNVHLFVIFFAKCSRTFERRQAGI